MEIKLLLFALEGKYFPHPSTINTAIANIANFILPVNQLPRTWLYLKYKIMKARDVWVQFTLQTEHLNHLSSFTSNLLRGVFR